MPLSALLPPPDIARRLPGAALLHDTLLAHITCIDAGTPIVRAAWNEASILPARVGRTYRFGPPTELRAADGAFPFHWIYAASEVFTSVWEAGLCLNDAEQPGTFYIERGARGALIATLRFDMPLKLVDLNGLASSKLGIFDDISDCDHAWCQWFGCMADAVIEREGGRVHGMIYPSRKHRGHDAIAISSRVLPQLLPVAGSSVVKFGDTAACRDLMSDRCCVAPPEGTLGMGSRVRGNGGDNCIDSPSLPRKREPIQSLQNDTQLTAYSAFSFSFFTGVKARSWKS